MKPIYLLCCLICHTLLSSAQMKSEVSTWIPKNNTSLKLVKSSYTITVTGKDGLTTETQEYSGSTSGHRTVYTYNEKHQKISETDYHQGDQPTATRYYSYDGNNMLQQMSYSYISKVDYPVTVKEEYAYDDKNNLIRKTRSASRGLRPVTWQYEYSEGENGGKVVTEYKLSKNKKRLKATSTYNAQNLLVRELLKNPDGTGSVIRTYEYTSGANGDWATRKVYEQRSIYATRLVAEYHKTILEQ
jgi:YD repeat-containing protein